MSESDNCGLLYFNPRSRKGSDANTAMSNNGTAISIHAPAKGATDCFPDLPRDNRYFNPRSRKGSDLKNLLELLRKDLFQSTLPQRERP